MRAPDEHPHWCARHEAPGAIHAAAIGDVEIGKIVLTIDLRQLPAGRIMVVLGVHDAETSTSHEMTCRHAAQLRDALMAALDLTGPGDDQCL